VCGSGDFSAERTWSRQGPSRLWLVSMREFEDHNGARGRGDQRIKFIATTTSPGFRNGDGVRSGPDSNSDGDVPDVLEAGAPTMSRRLLRWSRSTPTVAVVEAGDDCREPSARISGGTGGRVMWFASMIWRSQLISALSRRVSPCRSVRVVRRLTTSVSRDLMYSSLRWR
jgi:hypothetical protein